MFWKPERFALACLLTLVSLAGGCGLGADDGSLKIDPSSVHLSPGATQTFSVTVTKCDQTSVEWGVEEGGSGGEVTDKGVYTAPAATGTYHVTATCRLNRRLSDSATVTVE